MEGRSWSSWISLIRISKWRSTAPLLPNVHLLQQHEIKELQQQDGNKKFFKKCYGRERRKGASQRITPWAGRDRSGKSNSALSGSKCRDPHFQLKVCYSHGFASDERSCRSAVTFIYLPTGDNTITMARWNVKYRLPLPPHTPPPPHQQRGSYQQPIRTKWSI